MSGSPLRLESVCHSFGAVEVLRDLRLEVRAGEFAAVVGPSGCGKTTLLNLMSGCLPPTSGRVLREASTRMVYQQDGLFPWLTARQNIALGAGQMKEEAARRRGSEEWIRLIGLQGFEEHYPHQLSGGMRQRVELARAMIGGSDVLLLDEPFSALDYQTRLRMRGELARVLRERPRTVVLVTHDIEEAAQLADRVVLLSERPGRIVRELCLSLPRPRSLTHPAVVAAVREILGELGLEQPQEPAQQPAQESGEARERPDRAAAERR